MSYRLAPGWRIAGLAAILSLLGAGAAGLALAEAPAGSSVIKRPSLGSSPVRPARWRQSARSDIGLRLLREAAVACQGTSYGGEQVVLWRVVQGRSSSSVLRVWHQPGQVTLVQEASGAPGDAAAAARPAAADDQDLDGPLGLSDRLLVLLQTNYDVVYAGRGSADDRGALVVEVRRPGGGLAARFWLDAVTKLPLRREIFATNARMISEDAFINLKLGVRGLGGMPAPAAAPWTAQLDQARLAGLRARGWPLPGQLPGNLALFAATEMSGRSSPVIDLSYSDGLAVVSLFVQRGELARPMPGWRLVAMPGRTVYSMDPDDRSFAWSGKGFVYTVVADPPIATASQVAAALPATDPPGFWVRIGRGFRRFAAWLNPLR